MPKILIDQFTLNGIVPFVEVREVLIFHFFQKINSTKPDESITWTRDAIEELVLKDVFDFHEFGGQGSEFDSCETRQKSLHKQKYNGIRINLYNTAYESV